MEQVSVFWFVWVAKAVSYGAVVFQVLELFDNFIDEVEYIWRGRFRLISCLYFFSRYVPLIAQMLFCTIAIAIASKGLHWFSVNIVISQKAYATPTHRMCMASNTLKGASSQLTATCVEAIQMIRVHALYNRSRRSGNVLLCVFVIGTALEVAGTVATIASLKPGVSGNLCLPSRCSVWSISLFTAGFALIQGCLLFMTFSRVVFTRHCSWIVKTPVISVVLRDGVGFFVIISAVIASITGFELVRGLNQHQFVWNLAFSWYICILSVAGCRMILSIRKLGTPSHSRNRHVVQDSSLIQFSTIIDISEFTSISEMPA